MRVNNLNWKIGGEAGYGILSAGEVFAYAMAHGGLETFAYLEYPSLIRGGHNTYQVWVREDSVESHSSQVDLLVALNKETIERHLSELVEDGGLLYDENDKTLREYACSTRQHNCFAVPMEELAKQAGGEKVMRNMVAVGASLGLVGYPYDYLVSLIERVFSKKGKKMVELNQAAAKLGYEHTREHYASQFNYRLEVRPGKEKRMLINGNEAIAMGAIKAGLKFYAAYPMTPASSILHYLAAQEREYKLVVKQTEDEIAAMNMAVGASFTGARSMVATSGGGFSLMVEALGLAGMVEAGVVVVLAQRPGPATGLPTWTEQGDLRFALHAAQGDFPRVILAPGDPEECFSFTFLAHNLADKYQLPVIILTDKYLAEARQTVPMFSLAGLKIDRGELADTSALPAEARFARYAVTPSGVSPRSIPGQPGGVFVANSDEHEPTGLADEEAEMRLAQMDKRMKKLQTLRSDIPESVKLYGPKEADVTIVGWGSTKGPILEAMKQVSVNGKSKSVNFLQVRLLEPFPIKEIDTVLRQAKRRVLVENNYSGQLGGLIREKTGIDITEKLLKYDGRPIHPEEIISYVNG
ncbi:MAG: 2-oxoacid:acceptor oxidoreductase subunit alpha [Candidatus Veblenbacteria bacterium]|nr:2-oxoacid:acceptor oxidoreductase subunit alpha [Candidatus Veblenbacteria bacterium]